MTETLTVWLPKEVRAKLPALMAKYNVTTNSMLIRKILQEAIDFHLSDEQTTPIGGLTSIPIGVTIADWPLRPDTHLDKDKIVYPEVCIEHNEEKYWDVDSEIWICRKCTD